MAVHGMSAGAALSAGLTDGRRARGSLWSTLRLAQSVASERRALRALDADALRDIGVTDEMAREEAARGLFDLPKRR